MVRFFGSDGTDAQNCSAAMRVFCDATPASNKVPGRIVFETTDTLTYPRERMRIDSSGRVVIGGPGSNAQASNTYIGGGALAVLGTPYTPNTYACFAMGRVGANVTANTTITNIRLNGGPLGTGRGAEINAAADANWSDASSHPTRLTFHTVASSSTSSTERLRIASNGNVGVNNNNPTAKLHVGAAYNETGAIIGGGALGYNDVLQCNTANGHRRFTVAGDGEIYGPTAGRKNWFDNGSFDCTYGGRKNNVSMDYGNHHAYGWVTDRFQSRNSVQWTRSTNVPTGKGFSYSTLTNGAGGQLVQAVELPDYGDMGVFTPGSYWCVSFWSTAACNPAGAAFSYDLGSTKTDIPTVGSGGYATTGETASGTSTGTFSRYYRVFGPIPNSIISGAIAAYWQWGFSAAGYTTGFQLERVPTSTSKPTPYEHVHPSVTIARCRRYAYRVYNSRHVTGWKRHDSNINWETRHPVLGTHMPSGSNQSVDPVSYTHLTLPTKA